MPLRLIAGSCLPVSDDGQARLLINVTLLLITVNICRLASSSFLRIAAIPFAIWSTDYSERLYLKPHSGQSRLLWLSSDVLLITVNVLLNTVNLCWENRRVVASATDNSECYVTRVMPLLMYKSRGPPAPGLSVIAYTLKVIVCLSRLGTGWRCKNAHSRLTTVNVCEVLPVSTDYSECRSLQSGFTDYSERRRTLILFTTDLLWPGIWRCLAFHLVPMLYDPLTFK